MPDNKELYGTSDIMWKEIAPKLFELSNRQPVFGDMTGAEKSNYDTGMQMRERERSYADEPNPPGPMGMKRLGLPGIETAKDRRNWRKQLRNFGKAMNDPSADLMAGIGELVDSGALYWRDNERDPSLSGWYTRVPFKGDNRLWQLADRWADFQDDIEKKFGIENDPESIRKREEYWKQAAPIFQR